MHVMAQSDEVFAKNANQKKGIAIGGYDPVSYFDNNPQEGHSKLAYKYRGVNYFFSSEVNLNKFKNQPNKYEPQYGGWCAFAMGDYGDKVKIDPETFKIVDGKLYLFYNFFFTNTLDDWNKDEINLKSKADKNWNSMLK